MKSAMIGVTGGWSNDFRPKKYGRKSSEDQRMAERRRSPNVTLLGERP
jgi:hypothetical protein